MNGSENNTIGLVEGITLRSKSQFNEKSHIIHHILNPTVKMSKCKKTNDKRKIKKERKKDYDADKIRSNVF